MTVVGSAASFGISRVSHPFRQSPGFRVTVSGNFGDGKSPKLEPSPWYWSFVVVLT